MRPAARHRCESSLMPHRCRPRELRLKNSRSSSSSVTKATTTNLPSEPVFPTCSLRFSGHVNPDQNDDVATANIPHVMYYAPNVSDKDVGAAGLDIRIECDSAVCVP